MRKKISIILVMALVGMAFALVPLCASSEEPEGPPGPELPEVPELPEGPPRAGEGEWWVEGEGTDFELTNSPYLNVALTSSENVYIYLESLPRIVSLNIEAVDTATSTELTYSGFEPSTTYYRYQESYLQETFTTDDTGSFIFTQDITTPHHVFIQEEEATIYIRSNGDVDPASAPITRNVDTYTLTDNIYESIWIQKSGITLDGDGYSITADYHYGIYGPSVSGITITNAIIGGASSYGIYLVSSTNSVISGCTVTNSANGIYLYNSGGSTVTGTTTTGNTYTGINIYYSPSSAISGNTISNNGYYGIYEVYSTGSTMSGNTVTNNGWSHYSQGGGIFLYINSGGCTLTGNTVTDNKYGIYLFAASGNTLRDNTMATNKYNFGARWNSNLNELEQDIDTSNTVDGKPIYYWDGRSSETVPSDAGYIALLNCDQITVDGGTLSNNYHSIFIVSSTDTTIQNVNILNSYAGIYGYSSSGTTITGSTISSNDYWGIYLADSSGCSITGNTISYNNLYEIYLYSSDSSTITGNTISGEGNTNICIYLSSSGSSTITGNTISSFAGSGIRLYLSGSSTVSGNTVSNGYSGIWIYSSIDCTLIDNTVDGVRDYGIYLMSSGNCYLRNNIMTNNNYNFNIGGSYYEDTDYIQDIDTSNTVDGKPIYYLVGATNVVIDSFTDVGFVGLVNSDHITVKDLTLVHNSHGVFLVGTSDSTLQNLQISNVRHGITMLNSDGNIVNGNTVSSRPIYGIHMVGSNLNTITGNTFTDVSAGIFMYGVTLSYGQYTCSDNLIGGNTISDCSWGGIVFQFYSDSFNNIISGNTISQFGEYGIQAQNSRSNTVSGNTISGGKYGIYEYGFYNSISGNTISDCWHTGLRVGSTGSTIIGNTVSGSDNGISIYYSRGLTLKSNVMENNNYSFGFNWPGSLNYLFHDIDTTNIINGDPIYYYLNRSLESVPRDAGYVGIVNSFGITVEGMTLQNNVQGLLLVAATNCSIENMNFVNNYRGIEGFSASGTSISGCTISGSRDGIYMRSIPTWNDNIILSGNTFSDILYYTIYFYRISDSTISGNTISTSYHGFYLYLCESTTISGNTITSVVSASNGWGMYINGNDNSITGNEVSGYFYYGLRLYQFHNSVVSGNTISGNQYGLQIFYSNGNTIFHNNIIDNTNQLYNLAATNTWDNGEGEGNYWSDYEGEDLDNDGVGDTLLPHQGVDNYPLMDSWSPSPTKAIEKLIIYVQGLGLPHGIENSLVQQLNAAMNALSNNQTHTAVNILNAFMNHVEALRGNKLTDEQADYLIASAMHIIVLIESQ
jgi:parallel beta-helix repeat protein